MSSPEFIVYPTGHHASGKTELCSHLTVTYDFAIVETGAMVRGLYAARAEEFAELSISGYVASMNSNEPDYFDKHLHGRVQSTESPRVLVNGMRAYANIVAMERMNRQSKHSILWLELDPATLKQRYQNREKKILSDEEFTALLAVDSGLGVDEIREHADYVIHNEGSIQTLRERADVAMKDIGLLAVGAA